MAFVSAFVPKPASLSSSFSRAAAPRPAGASTLRHSVRASASKTSLPNYTDPKPDPDESGPVKVYPPLQKKDPAPGSPFSFVRFFVDDFSTRPFFANLTGAGTTVAVLDTGIDVTHPALSDVVDLSLCRNFTTDNGGRADDVTDGDGHGTHCAGLIAAQAQGGIMSGVAPGCRIAGMKVLSNGGEADLPVVPLRIAAAIDFAVEGGCDVITMSLGLPDGLFNDNQAEMDVMYQACQNALAKGVIVVAAAGNLGRSTGNTIGTSFFALSLPHLLNRPHTALPSFSEPNHLFTAIHPPFLAIFSTS